MFFAVNKSRDSLCAQSRFRDKKEKARTDCLLEFGVPGGTVCVYIFIPADVGRTRLFSMPK